MTDTSRTVPSGTTEFTRLPWFTRVAIGMSGAAIVAVFVTAMCLTPDVRGFGTHQQLGLGPCTFQQLTGLHCPHCGMTTSFSHIVRGQIRQSMRSNPSGIVLASLSIVMLVWCFGTSVVGRSLWTTRPLKWFVGGTLGYLAVAILIWAFRIL